MSFDDLRKGALIFVGGLSLITGGFWVRSGGLGVKETLVEHVFTEKGTRMSVMRDDFNGFGHDRYVQIFANDLPELKDGDRIGSINRNNLGMRIYNYHGISDSGKEISVSQEGYQVKDVRNAK